MASQERWILPDFASVRGRVPVRLRRHLWNDAIGHGRPIISGAIQTPGLKLLACRGRDLTDSWGRPHDFDRSPRTASFCQASSASSAKSNRRRSAALIILSSTKASKLMILVQ